MINPGIQTQTDSPIAHFQRRVALALGIFPLLLLFLTLIPTNTVVAQENESQPAVQQMRLQILPEYDDPRVLVIAQGRLDVSSGAYDGPITFRLPAGVQINQMAVLDLELGGPVSLPFETEPDPEDTAWMLVTYTLTNPHFFFEYYTAMPSSGSQKQFSFVLKPYQDIATLSMEVQQPLKAEAFTLEPAANTSRSDTAGFTFWQYPDQALAKDEERQIQTRYTKTDPNPSVVRQGETAVQTTTAQPTAEAQDLEVSSTVVGVALGGIVLVVAVGFFRHRIRPRLAQPAAVTTAARRESPPVVVTDSGQARFCTNCGQPLPGSAKFCPYCGSGVRR